MRHEERPAKTAPNLSPPLAPYAAPKLIVYGSVRNMTGGSCGFNFDGFFGNPNNGNPFEFGC